MSIVEEETPTIMRDDILVFEYAVTGKEKNAERLFTAMSGQGIRDEDWISASARLDTGELIEIFSIVRSDTGEIIDVNQKGLKNFMDSSTEELRFPTNTTILTKYKGKSPIKLDPQVFARVEEEWEQKKDAEKEQQVVEWEKQFLKKKEMYGMPGEQFDWIIGPYSGEGYDGDDVNLIVKVLLQESARKGTALFRLYLVNTKFTDTGLVEISKNCNGACKELYEIYLSGTAVTDKGLHELARTFQEGKQKNLSTITLEDTSVTSTCAQEVSKIFPMSRIYTDGATFTNGKNLRA